MNDITDITDTTTDTVTDKATEAPVKSRQNLSLTEGPVFHNLILFSMPMIAGNILQQIYNLADTLIVGRWIGADALAAVGSAYTLMIFITSLIIGLCMGSGAFFSADIGAGEKERLSEDVRISFVFIGLVSIVIYFIIYPLMNQIIRLLSTPESIVGITRDYISIVFAGIFFIFLYNFFAFYLRAWGNSVTPLIFLGISSALNIVLDIAFVCIFGMGVKGAAIATVIAQVVAGIGIMIYAVAKMPKLRKSLSNISTVKSFSKNRVKRIILNDIATGIQQSVMNFGILMIQGLVNSFGTVIMASFAAAVKIDTIAYMPTQEFGNAYSLFISQNVGAGKRERVSSGTRVAMVTTIIFSLAISIIIFFCANDLMQIFVGANETEIIYEGARYLRIEGAAYIGIGILFLWYGYFRGIGRPNLSLLLTVVSLGTRVALSYAFAKTTPLGVLIIWLSIPIGWMLADFTGLLLYKHMDYKL